MTSFKSWHLWVGAMGVAVLGLGIRAELSAADELGTAHEALSRGETDLAIRHYQYALHWRAPLSGAGAEAAEALSRIADDARARGDRRIELKALRRLRGGILAIRSFSLPMAHGLESANLRLAKATAEEQMALGGPTIGGRSLAELESHHLKLLRLDPAPDPGWAMVVVLSFLGWVGLSILTILRGFDASLTLQQPVFRRAALGGMVCFGVWILALTQA